MEGVAFSTDFRGYAQNSIDFGRSEWNARLVLSPHQYGPSVSHSAPFKEPTFPQNLPPMWTEKWAFLKGLADRPVVVRTFRVYVGMYVMGGAGAVGPLWPCLTLLCLCVIGTTPPNFFSLTIRHNHIIDYCISWGSGAGAPLGPTRSGMTFLPSSCWTTA